jgi:hypothetical protein
VGGLSQVFQFFKNGGGPKGGYFSRSGGGNLGYHLKALKTVRTIKTIKTLVLEGGGSLG